MFKNITQMIPTIQGEGKFLGVPSILMRFHKCNLVCPFCDTQWSNKHTNSKFDISNIFDYLEQYPRIDNIMFTGGEPFLYAKQMGQILTEIDRVCPFIKNVEIETNGVLHNEKTFKEFFIFPPGKFKITLNISPKLGPECWADKKTPMQIVATYVENSKILKKMIYDHGFDYYYKIVYDVAWKKYIDEFLNRVTIPYDKRNPVRRIYMMPKTPDFRDYDFNDPISKLAFYSKFQESCINTAEFCMKYGYKFSAREHVWLYLDNKNEQIEVMKNG